MKTKIITLAFDDSPHLREDLVKYHLNSNEKCMKQVDLVGVVCRGIQLIYVMKSKITVDGIDSTKKIIQTFNACPYKKEIRLIFIDSPTLAGFNPPNPFEIFEQTNIPIVLLPDTKPQNKIHQIYCEIFPNRLEQISFLEKLPKLDSITVEINQNPIITKEIYFHLIGITRSEIIPLFHYLSEFSGIPEPLRLAHLIASSQIL